jgi:hypothetical protein
MRCCVLVLVSAGSGQAIARYLAYLVGYQCEILGLPLEAHAHGAAFVVFDDDVQLDAITRFSLDRVIEIIREQVDHKWRQDIVDNDCAKPVTGTMQREFHVLIVIGDDFNCGLPVKTIGEKVEQSRSVLMEDERHTLAEVF